MKIIDISISMTVLAVIIKVVLGPSWCFLLSEAWSSLQDMAAGPLRMWLTIVQSFCEVERLVNTVNNQHRPPTFATHHGTRVTNWTDKSGPNPSRAE